MFLKLIHAYCWLLVAASPVLLGALVGALLGSQIGGPAGVAFLVAAVLIGMYFGVRLACHASRRNRLVEYSAGLLPLDVAEKLKDKGATKES